MAQLFPPALTTPPSDATIPVYDSAGTFAGRVPVPSVGPTGALSADESGRVRPSQAPRDTVRRQLEAIAEGDSLSAAFAFDRLNSDASVVTGSASVSGAWLADVGAGAYVDLRLPYGVIIGDSIAEGHPALHGRLHPNADSYDDDYANQPGQLAYELGRIWGLPMYNHGIGGQRADQVWARWGRDVLSQTQDPGDGRGSRTLPSGTLPHVVVIIAGINDIYASRTAAQVIADLESMAESCASNGIYCVMLTVGPHNSDNAARIAIREEINTWVRGTAPTLGALVVDWTPWALDPADSAGVRPDLFADSVHPNQAGYVALARLIASTVDAPLYLEGLEVESATDPASTPSRYARPLQYEVTVGASVETLAAPNAEAQDLALPAGARGIAHTLRLKVTAVEPEVVNPYTGFSAVRAVLSSRRAPVGASSSAGTVGPHIAAIALAEKVSGTWELIEDDTAYGMAASTPIAISSPSKFVAFNFASPVHAVTATLISTNLKYDLTVSYAAYPITGARIHMRETLDGGGTQTLDPATVPDGTRIQVVAFRV